MIVFSSPLYQNVSCYTVDMFVGKVLNMLIYDTRPKEIYISNMFQNIIMNEETYVFRINFWPENPFPVSNCHSVFIFVSNVGEFTNIISKGTIHFKYNYYELHGIYSLVDTVLSTFMPTGTCCVILQRILCMWIKK